jgi:hypothetical protein
VSLSWRDRALVTLAPREVSLLRYPRRGKGAPRDRKSVTCPAAVGAAWQGAIEGLRELLAHPNLAAADVDVVLSNHFVRYLLLPWNPGLAGEREELAFAAARFQQVYGEPARAWSVRLSAGKPGMPALAAAVEQALIDAVAALLQGSVLRLRSLQPALMEACNARSRSVAPNAWIAMAEPGRLLLGLQRDGQWRSLRSRPLNGAAVSLAELIDQELLLLGVEPAGEKIYLQQSGTTPVELAGLQVERWAAAAEASR